MSQHNVTLVAKILIAICSFTFLIPEIVVMIASRFVQGIAVGLLISASSSGLYQTSLPEHRTITLPLQTVSFAVAYFLTTLVSLFDDGGTTIWRAMFIFQGCMALLDVLNMLLVIRDSDSIVYMLKFKGDEETKKLLHKVFREDKADEVYQEFKKVIGEIFLI